MSKYVHIIIPFLTGIYLLGGCTPYNADKANTGLIQGKWTLTGVNRTTYDTVKVDYNEERTYLIFEGNKCAQYMSDWEDTLNFIFIIHNYELSLYKDDELLRRLDIEALSNDSLILSVAEDKWIYKKLDIDN
jgi:hypothetical protein